MLRLPLRSLLVISAIAVVIGGDGIALGQEPQPAAADAARPLAVPTDKPAGESYEDPFAGANKSDKPRAAKTPDLVDVRQALAKKTVFDFVDVPLYDAIDMLREIHRINIYVDQNSVEQAGIAFGKPATFSMADISLGAGLRHLLRGHGLTWTVEGEMLVITASDDHDRLATRVYDIADLAESLDESIEWGGADDIMELITTVLAPESWNDVGGPGSMDFHEGLLVVSQREEIHEHLSHYLDALRKARANADAAKRPVVIETRTGPAAAAIRETLRGRADLNFTDTPLQEVVNLLRKKHKLPIVIQQQSLEEAGVGLDAPVTLTARNVVLGSALTNMLRTLELAYTIGDEVLLIHSEDDPGLLDIKIYPVADLLGPEDETTAQPVPETMGCGFSGCLWPSEQFVDTITATISPQTWDEVGGMGTIKLFTKGKSLIVAQDQEAHAQVETLLADMRKTRAAQDPKARSHKEEGDPEEVQLVIYALRPHSMNYPRASEDELEKLIKDLIEPNSWGEGKMFLRALTNKLVIRHQRQVHKQIRKLLHDLYAIYPDTVGNPHVYGPTGFGGAPMTTGGGFQ